MVNNESQMAMKIHVDKLIIQFSLKICIKHLKTCKTCKI